MAPKKLTLKDLRSEIDRIDDSIHDLLMERAQVVEKVREVKDENQPKYRPGREAEIFYRLSARHKGAYSKKAILKMWRELISGTLMLEGPFFVAVQAPNGNDGYMDLARDHFGAFAPIIRHQTAVSVIEDVTKGNATVGVLPFPAGDTEDVWCRYLANGDEDRPMIVCRLPFFGRSNARGAQLDALVISNATPTVTGRDKTLFAFPVTGQISNARIKSAFTESGLETGMLLNWPMLGGEYKLFIAEVNGFIAGDDNHLEGVLERLEGHTDHLVWLGAYATPLSDEELTTTVEGRRGVDRRRQKRDGSDRRKSDHGTEARR